MWCLTCDIENLWGYKAIYIIHTKRIEDKTNDRDNKSNNNNNNNKNNCIIINNNNNNNDNNNSNNNSKTKKLNRRTYSKRGNLKKSIVPLIKSL